MDTNQYMEMFLEESREHLQSLNECLLVLEQNPEDSSVLNEIFRSAHTIKGMSATMGFTEIAELTHEMENVLDLLRKEQLKANEDIVDTIFKCVDALEQMVESLGSGEGDGAVEVGDLVKKLNAIANGEAVPSAASTAAAPVAPTAVATDTGLDLNETDLSMLKTAQDSGLQAFQLTVTLAGNCLLKSARAYMVINALEEIGDIVKTVPPVEELEQEKFEHSFDVIFVTGGEEKKIEENLLSISEIETVEVKPINISKQLEQNKAAEAAAPAETSGVAAKAPDKKAENKKVTMHDKLKGGQSVRVDIEKLDALMNLVGELVINKTRLEQIGTTQRLPELVETIEQMDRVTTDLQSVVMKVRMVPVGQVFNRFPRMVRDLAKDLNKEINLTIEGEETELDRTVIDEIGDPLVHLIRNSLDHGVEHPDERLAKGKPKTGEVGLIARHEGNNVIIMVTDDGKGINAGVIRRKALEKGLISQADADNMDDAEAVRLVFLPGFSTADVITDVSGRGVGMDVVRSKIEALGGVIDVETKIDEGSVFKIKLPLTLAIIQALLIRVQEEIYAIPLGSINSTINIKPDAIKTVQNREVILLRGQIIPIMRLDKALNVPQTREEAKKDLFVVVVHIGDRKCGIIVDALIGQQEIVIKTLGKLLAGLKVISGATVLGDGRVALILDAGALMQ